MKCPICVLFLFLSVFGFGQWVNGNPDYDGVILAMDKEINNLHFFEPLPTDSASLEEMDEFQKLIDLKYNDVLDGKYSIYFLQSYVYNDKRYCTVHITDNYFFDVPTIQDLPKGYGSFDTELCLVEASFQEGNLLSEIEEIFRRLNVKP
jgi:hypothetical protein